MVENPALDYLKRLPAQLRYRARWLEGDEPRRPDAAQELLAVADRIEREALAIMERVGCASIPSAETPGA